MTTHSSDSSSRHGKTARKASEKRLPAPLPESSPNAVQRAQRIANTAARLIAENGLTDFNAAKRKALHRLGLPENTPLPDNPLVEAELRVYQRLFQGNEHAERITASRKKARDFLVLLQRFNPYLTGPVLDGTAGRFPEIDIQLFTDSAKNVEFFLLNEHIDYEHSVPRSERAEAVLTLDSDGIPVNLIVYPPQTERSVFKTRDGRTRPRMKLDALKHLLEQENT